VSTTTLSSQRTSRLELSIKHYCRYRAGLARSRAVKFLDRFLDPQATRFYSLLVANGHPQLSYIDVLPQQKILYLAIPKCGSTTIRTALAAMIGEIPRCCEHVHLRRQSILKSPKQVGASTFYRLVKDESALRFSFVRNPYDRLVSAWADKFQNKPLVPGDDIVGAYLRKQQAMNLALPKNADQTLSFADFVHFVAATADNPTDMHWRPQHDLLNLPGVSFDFIGRLETFSRDFARVIEHARADQSLAAAADAHLNKSQRRDWRDYYTSALAHQVYRIYERDFDRLAYPRAV
jgi:hypothetical protein